ncbi:MAG: VTC domain-containing protein [Bacteroidetes bacterium]|nr:VTC domain-containing protein [Bacteroidota bacterium]
MNLPETLAKLNPIGLEAMEGVELMNRLDEKFLILSEWIPSLVSHCSEHYEILEVKGERITKYENQFLETPALDSFENHTRGRKDRFKARIRRYGSNGISFLEVKHKTVHGRTLKDRLLRSKNRDWNAPLNESEWDFLHAHYPYKKGELTSMQCSFDRCTLVSTKRQERVTIDSNIRFQSDQESSSLQGLAILEVKQVKIDRFSPIHEALKTFMGHPPPLARSTSMSKYIIGTLLLNPDLPPRTYRSLLRSIRGLIDYRPKR